jgi:hypothetical protein
MANSKIYTWSVIVDQFMQSVTNYTKYKEDYDNAVDYYYNFYCGDIPSIRYSEKDVQRIVDEMDDYAQHKIRLRKTEEAQAQLKKEYPNIDAYIESLDRRGPFGSIN